MALIDRSTDVAAALRDKRSFLSRMKLQRGFILNPYRFGAGVVPSAYATWNPGDKGANCTLSGGDLTATMPANSSVRGTVGVSAGKWYWEYRWTGGYEPLVGIATSSAATFAAGSGVAYPGSDANGWSYYAATGNKFNNGTSAAYGASWLLNDFIGVSLDMDAGTLAFSKNGTSQGVAFSGLAGKTVYPMVGGGTNTGTGGSLSVALANFGASALLGPVPAGYHLGLYTGTPAAPAEIESQFDAATKGANSTLTGIPVKTAEVWASSGARTDQYRATGRRCFGIKLISTVAPQAFFAGIAKVGGWNGSFSAGQLYLWYTASTNLLIYPAGTVIAVTGKPANPTAANDIMYYDVNLDTGTMALKLNGGSWSTPAALTSYVAGYAYSIAVEAPSTSTSAKIKYTVLTTAAELGANIPAGAVPWDNLPP